MTGPAFDPTKRGLDTPARLRPRSPGAALLEDCFLAGGWRNVRDIPERDAIPVKARSELMHVFVADDGTASAATFFMPEGVDLADNASWQVAPSGGGGGGTGHGALGTPTDGSYLDGAVALIPGQSADDAIDAINEFLGAIAPTMPGDLTGTVLALTGTTLFRARLPSGLPAAWNPFTPGDEIQTLVVDGTYQLATPNPSQRFNDGLDTSVPGDVVHVLNVADHDSRDIALGAGTTGDMEITDVSVFQNIWRKVNARIAFDHAATLTEGQAVHAIRHDPDGGPPNDQTADTIIFFDDTNPAPSFSVSPSVVVAVELLRFLSGIQYYREGTQFDVSFTAAAGIFEKAFHPDRVATVQVPSAPDADRNPVGVPAVTDTFPDTASLTLTASSVADNSPSADVTLRKPDGTNVQAGSALARGINTHSAPASTDTTDIFVDEARRLDVGTATAFDSTVALPSGEAQVQNGQLVHGADGDYAGHAADDEYDRKIVGVTLSGGTLSLGGVSAATIAPFGTGTLNALLQLETDGVFFDLGLSFGINNGDGSGSSPANSKGAKIGASGGDLTFSLGTFSTGNNGNEMRSRFRFIGANGIAITSMAVT